MKVISLYILLMVYTFFYINEIKCAAIICDETTKAKTTIGITKAPTMTIQEEDKNREIRVHINQTDDGVEVAANKGVKKLLHSIQCTLEKAKPWVDELEHEAKRLEQAAKRLGLGILNTFGEFMGKIIGDIHETVITTTKKTKTTATATTTTTTTTSMPNIKDDRIAESEEVATGSDKLENDNQKFNETLPTTITITTTEPTVVAIKTTTAVPIKPIVTDENYESYLNVIENHSVAVDGPNEENDENEIFNSFEKNMSGRY